MAFVSLALGLLGSGAAAVAAPSGFPASGNGLWYTEPAVNWSTQYLPIGNGYLGAMVNGNPVFDRIQLNIESLWSGGPFADPSYNGGNHQPSERSYLASQLARIRDTIFSSSNGTIEGVEPLPIDAGAYGSYSGAGYLNINRTASGGATNYARWLDMDNAVLNTIWTEPSGSFNRTYFCSNPTRACTVHTVSSTPGGFSATFSFSSLDGLPTRNITCLDNNTIQLRGYAGSPGMLYEILGKIQQSGPANSSAGCSVDEKTGDAVLVVKGSTEAWVNWVGGTDYSMETGNGASGYRFKGSDPHAGLVTLLAKASGQSVETALGSHIADYRSALGGFSLNIGEKFDSSKTTAQLRKEYKRDVGNPYFEWLMFNYGRYMLVGSTRSYLPANLQGVWARDAGAPWSGDYREFDPIRWWDDKAEPYHISDANINIQMNYWFAEMTNMKVTSALWDYMAKTWAPRGAETAKTLYNTTRGWVTHNEMNVRSFIYALEGWNPAEWANYPESAAWMMIHVYDHFDYTNDVAWWRAQGWPLLKGVALFWLDHLIEDRHFKDGSLVTAPCNSPEQAIVTLGCSHSQQLVWQLFEAVEKGFSASGDNDTAFLHEVQTKKLKLDKGIRIGSWGQLQEWKLDFDRQTDLHRHLSHLIGLYPGYVLANFKAPTGQSQEIPKLTREQVLKASEISLRARGDGTGPDGDAGWEKVWRAACWAQLQNSTQFYHILTYAIEHNFAENLWSLYNPFAEDPIFQIDANLGYPAAVLNALVQAPDTSSLSDALVITILPALPSAWSSGSIVGARIRGGMTLDLTWSNGKAVQANLRVDPVIRSSISQYEYEETGFGGSADIFSGQYRKSDGSEVKVAIKCIRMDTKSASREEKDKLERKLAHELTIWDSLRGGRNIIELFGTITGIGLLTSPVCEWCPWNLQDYLDRKRPPPRHMKMILEILQGLDYMHNLNSGPIAHGDIKLSNILVTANETAMICDFGRSGKPRTSAVEVSESSPFIATVRYMSPELFAQNVTRPTPAADMWAYGCIAFEILCRIPPYHEVSGQYEIAELIKAGHPPSIRPRGARASLVNDALWDALSSCWKAPDWRPTSHTFLDQLVQMQERGEIPPSPVLLDLFPIMDSGPVTIIPWPEGMVDLKGMLEVGWNVGKLASSVRSNVWMRNYYQKGYFTNVVVKVPRLNIMRENSARHDHLQNILRKMVLHRYGVRHRNIVDLLGIDSNFAPHPGFVFENCSGGNLVTYFKENRIIRHELTRPPAPEANTYSLMLDILEGLQYMHSYPIPIPQGDLTPENILVDRNGVAKISLFSIGRALATLPPTEAVTASIGSLLPLRWISPELLSANQQPTTESDMWAVGCVCYWILTGLQPYATHHRDDFAGVESVRGHPPGTLENVDIYHSFWITNAPKIFVSVVDLAGKVKQIGTGGAELEAKIAQYVTVWKQFNYVKQRREEDVYVSTTTYETTYAPKWYSKSAPVVVKMATNRPFNKQPSIATIRNEITVMAQLDHPRIHKLLGIDFSTDNGQVIVIEFCSRVSLDLFLRQAKCGTREFIKILMDIIEALTYLHDHPNGSIAHGNIQPANIFVLPNGRAKLTNFSCAFQYIVTHPNSHMSLSSMAAGPKLPSLYCSPEQHEEADKERIFLPTLLGDIWSFGSVVLSMFSAAFRDKDPASHAAQLMAGVVSYQLDDAPEMDSWTKPLIDSTLVLDASQRRTARSVMNTLALII
ncbi:hypothetical protein OPQ81_003318 [Rhizoctonia solani]|nr:hypothetical protein OPQ81_003318 [Rhizoctonia solani]